MPGVRFTETQFTDWRIALALLIALSAVYVWRRGPRWPVVVAMIAVAAGFLECRLDTRVDDLAIQVRLGWIPIYTRVIARTEIVSAVPALATSGPDARDAWGWGAHWERDGTFAVTVRGPQGVVLQLRDGSRVRIGTQAPGTLARALSPAAP